MPFRVYYICIFACTPIASQAFQLASQQGDFPPSKGYVNVNECPQTVSKDMWGLWVDGRDAHRGIDAYGEKYHNPVMSSLQVAYQLAQSQPDVELIYQTFILMIKTLQPSWRASPNPVSEEVRPCHEVMPQDVVQDIMSTVEHNWTDPYMVSRPPRPAHHYHKSFLAQLFDTYNKEVHDFPGRDAELLSIARLAQNMAFLHPLGDQNGRSRLLLIQYLLRQRHIGCGTMMYNNNKNIYFSTASDYAKILDEGTKIYDKASVNSFSTNPWSTPEVQDSHRAHFPTPAYMPKLEQCWQTYVNAANEGTSPVRTQDGVGSQLD